MINSFIDTHIHLDGEEFADDLQQVIERAKAAGCSKVFIPGIDVVGIPRIQQICRDNEGFAFPMYGLHPEEVKEDWAEQLQQIKPLLTLTPSPIAIGEVGLDFYWSRDYYDEQLLCFEEQVKWAIEMCLPLMIHCRKGQAEMVKILRKYESDIVGGVFHCFTGNEQEARELLSFPRFSLGIGGVSTFKKSHLPEVLPNVVPLERLVLETDAPYMAPVPRRGERNESSFVPYIITRLAEAYGVSEETICTHTTNNALRIFFPG
ncbi:MAG: TatD family hydrolase [Prevotella sp.]|nr:TatD family hydrolase [Candidatus Equicola stercoris]